MKMYDMRIRRDSAICTAVEMCQDFGMTFIDTVDKIAAKFTLSKEHAQESVIESWRE